MFKKLIMQISDSVFWETLADLRSTFQNFGEIALPEGIILIVIVVSLTKGMDLTGRPRVGMITCYSLNSLRYEWKSLKCNFELKCELQMYFLVRLLWTSHELKHTNGYQNTWLLHIISLIKFSSIIMTKGKEKEVFESLPVGLIKFRRAGQGRSLVRGDNQSFWTRISTMVMLSLNLTKLSQFFSCWI